MDRVMLDTLCSGRCCVERTGVGVSWACAGGEEQHSLVGSRLPSVARSLSTHREEASW